MNREYNDNKMYNSALDELRFSEEAKSRMVDRLMTAAEQPEQPVAIHRVRRFPRITAVGVAAALVLSIGAGATGVFKSAGEAFAGVFGPTADTEIIDQIGHPIGASDTAGGVTVTADAILFDGYNYLISYTLEKEDGSAFDCTKNPDTGLYDLYWKRSDSTIGRGVDGASGSSYFYDENPSDNAIQYVETMSYNDAVQTGGTVKITFGDLCVLNSENGEPTTIAKGAWRLKFQLEAGNSAVELPAGQNIDVNGRSAAVDTIVISPIGYHVVDTVDGEGGKWYHIQSGSVTGYIKAQYFVTGEEASKIAREVGTTYAKVTNTSTLRLRETPSLEGKTLDLLSADAEYEVIGEEGDFAKISVDNDLVGYVYKDYITTQVDFKQAVSVAEEQQQKAEEEKLKQEANAAIENLEQVKKKAEEESRAAETTAAAKETTAAAKETTKAPETSYSGTIEANPSESKAAGTTAAAKETTKAAETKAPTTAAATKATTASGVGPGGGPGTGGTSSSGNEVTNATRSAVVAYAKQFLGNPYVYGGTSLTNGADCSGFTMSVFAHFGISTGRSSRDQAAKGKEVAVSAVQPGDLLFYASGNYINHVALYIGNGQVIHASTAKSLSLIHI